MKIGKTFNINEKKLYARLMQTAMMQRIISLWRHLIYFSESINISNRHINSKIYTPENGNLFVIMRTVINHGRYDPSGKSTEHYSFLNIRGNFEKSGTSVLPIFIWKDRRSAQLAAAKVMAKKAYTARALTINESACDLGTAFYEFNEFDENHLLALTYYLPYGPFKNKIAKIAKTNEIFKNICSHASRILEVEDADSESRRIIERKINAEYPGWSLFSSAQLLGGKNSRQVIDLIRRGEIQMSSDLSKERLEQAIIVANKIIANKISK